MCQGGARDDAVLTLPCRSQGVISTPRLLLKTTGAGGVRVRLRLRVRRSQHDDRSHLRLAVSVSNFGKRKTKPKLITEVINDDLMWAAGAVGACSLR